MGIKTRFTDLVGVEHPIQLAPMGSAGTLELVAAVGEAGGHGMAAATMIPPPALGQLADGLRARTPAFGLNFLIPLVDREAVAVAAEKAPLVEFFYGEPDASLVEAVHAGGALASWGVASADEARAAVAAGCDLVAVQGVEAGGRIRGRLGLLPLLDQVLAAVEVPVVAGGGIASGRGVAAVLAAGADAARLGTRFVASAESGAHPVWIDGILASDGQDAVLSEAHSALPLGLGSWPGDRRHRILRSAVEAADGIEGDVAGELPLGDRAVPLPRFAVVPPSAATTGAVEAMALYAGQSAGGIGDVRPAGELVRGLAAEAEGLLGRLRGS